MIGGFMLTGIVLLAQLITGIVFAAGNQKNNKKEIGKGLLLATGICLLIGLSVCGSMLFIAR
jgi:hypothetical protein